MKKRGGWGRVGVQGVFARERPSTFAGCELPSQDVSDPRGVELHLRKVRDLQGNTPFDSMTFDRPLSSLWL